MRVADVLRGYAEKGALCPAIGMPVVYKELQHPARKAEGFLACGYALCLMMRVASSMALPKRAAASQKGAPGKFHVRAGSMEAAKT
jgi:hypothetical protein